MEPITAAALTLLLCSQIQHAGALPVRHHLANYQHDTLGNVKQGFETRNENSPCQVIPVTDEPLTGCTTTPPLPISVNKPPPLPPNVFYQPIVPYYVLPPVSGGSHVYGQGAGHAGFTQGGGPPRPPHSPFGASGFLRAPQWLLDLQRGKHLPGRRGSPAGSQRGSKAQRSDSKSSEEGSDSD